MSPVLVFGCRGQVGSCLMELAPELLGEEAVGLDTPEIDFAQIGQIEAALEKYKPKVVINAAAFTAVDLAEKETELARKVNALAPAAIAVWCAHNNVPMIHYSTDYVYSAEGNAHLHEDDPKRPLNAYGRTKLEGDQAIISAAKKYLIFRTSWVYHERGKNFVLTMLQKGAPKGAQEETLRVVADQVGSPTYARHLARATLVGLENAFKKTSKGEEFPSGVYHLCGGGEASWHEFAQEIFKQATELGFEIKVKEVLAVRSSDFVTAAKRPLNSRLNCSKAERVLGLGLPHWKEALNECLKRIPRSH